MTKKDFCGYCGKLLTSYDIELESCDRCGTIFQQVKPVSKAGDAEAKPDYEDGLYE